MAMNCFNGCFSIAFLCAGGASDSTTLEGFSIFNQRQNLPKAYGDGLRFRETYSTPKPCSSESLNS